MKKYSVDVKAFINVTVEAESASHARALAEDYVERSLSPSGMETEGWNDAQAEEGVKGRIATCGSWDIDGMSDVEKVDD